MRANRPVRLLFSISAVVLVTAWMFSASHAQQGRPAVDIDNDDIGGVVTGPKGPEAGVWVIAETRDLQSRFIRSVVTDDQGRYVIPDLPKANYTVWSRGYGLVDSEKMPSTPGRIVNHAAKPAPDTGRSGALLPRHLLVLDAEDSRRRPNSAVRNPDSERRRSAALDLSDEEQRLYRVPSARAAVHSNDSRIARHVCLVE